MYQVSPIPAFSDNYIWLLSGHSNFAAVVDPGDAKPVFARLTEERLELTEILITHHHPDHIGGVEALKAAFPNAKVYVPNSERFNALGAAVKLGESIHLRATDSELEVIELFGHTRDHIGYLDHSNAFVGDTLFSAGCGRLFEGTAEQLQSSLNSLQTLDLETKIYCAHEYTLSNIAFALNVEPSNSELIEYARQCELLRQNDKPTIPTTVRLEREINPFLRCQQNEIKENIRRHFAIEQEPSESEIFALLRQWKDHF